MPAKKTRKRTAKPKAPAEELVEKTTVMERPDEVETTTVVSSVAEAPFMPFEPKPFGSTEARTPPPKVDVPADGTLIRKDGSPVVYVMNDGKRRPIGDANVFAACGFGWNEIVVLPPKEIDPIPVGEVVARQGDLRRT